MKRLVTISSVILAALWAAACGSGGGGGGFTPPPPNPGNFSNASLKGQYAFTTTGESTSTAQLTRLGSFIADGQGNITGGIEDVNALGAGVSTFNITGGTYTINSDGHGLLNLNVNGVTLQLSITMTSMNDGLLVDLTANNAQVSTGSGNFVKQNAGAFSAAGLSGNYAFDFTGQYPDNSGNPTSVVGQFFSDSNGTITGGTEDINEGGSLSSLVAISGTYGDSGGTLGSFGRGLVTINDGVVHPQFVFYIVDNTRVRFLGLSGAGILSGDAAAQTNIPPNVSALNTGFVFALGGANGNGPLSELGRFTANGAALSNVIADVNDSVVAQANTVTGATITVDPSGNGRGTLAFTDPNIGLFQFVFYLTSPNAGVIQDISANIVADGSLTLQSAGPFSGANITGSYAVAWSGQSIQINGNTFDEEDLLGQTNIAGAALKGVSDINQFSGSELTGITTTGTLTFAGDGTGGDGSGASGGRNKMVVSLTTTSSTTINFVPYFASPNLCFFMSTDGNRVALGSLNLQQ